MSQVQHMMRNLCLGVFASSIMLGCSPKTAISPNVSESSNAAAVTIVDGGEPSQEQRQTMLSAKDALFQKLSGRLMEAMSSQGPAAAIAVCQKEAKQIAQAVGADFNLQIGRVGVRLRNPNNTGPQWAAPLIEAQTNVPTFAKLSNEHAAALLPIKLQSQCLMCHGPTEQIPTVISEQLAKLYPEDRATGFQEGDLRGWFWIEMPVGP